MKKALFTLTLVLVIAEFIAMLILERVIGASLGAWVPAIIDAAFISAVAIFTVDLMIRNEWISIRVRQQGRSEWMRIETGAIVFITEAMIMFGLDLNALKLLEWQVIVFDAVFLASVSSIFIYFLVLKPAAHEELDDVFDSGDKKGLVTNAIFKYAGVVGLLCIILIWSYQQRLNEYEQELVDEEANALEIIALDYNDKLSSAVLDLLMLANQSETKELFNSLSHEHARGSLEQDYAYLAHLKPYYEQIRLLDKEGKEIIRIEQQNAEPYAVSEKNLQDKSKRYYFKDGFKLPEGQIYISPLDLNVEHGKIEYPLKPVIRLVTPFFDFGGNKLGVVVINLNANLLLEALKDRESLSLGNLMLLNSAGYYLMGPDSEVLWGFMFEARKHQRFDLKHPDIWPELKAKPLGVEVKEGDPYVFKRLQFSLDGPLVKKTGFSFWYLVSHISKEKRDKEFSDARNTMIILFLALSGFMAVVVAMLTRSTIKRKATERQMHRMAYFDVLTGLANRKLFHNKLEEEIDRANRHGSDLTLFYLDLDKFKPINDELGHDAGDEVLVEVARRLSACFRNYDTVARLGGDEFAAILPEAMIERDINHLSERIINAFERPFAARDEYRSLGVSIGIARLTDSNGDVDGLVHLADQAMYQAKARGGNTAEFCESACS